MSGVEQTKSCVMTAREREREMVRREDSRCENKE